mmetsp:Transcript_16433/g.41519  ORF Transcript_16433/g.41519 Transcript_16433/m.41519 type:complete len:230 (-) Transcript_16433:1431-2120(-)
MRLLVPRGIPVRIKHDDRVSTSESDAERSSPGGEEVGAYRVLGVVEESNLILAASEGGAAIEAKKPGSLHSEVVLNHVKHRGELRVDKNLVASCMKAMKQTIKHLHLCTRSDDSLIRNTIILLTSRKQEGVVAALAKLHEEPLKLPPPGIGAILVHPSDELLCFTRIDQEPLVPKALHVTQGAPNHKRRLGRKVSLHVSLEPAEHQRLQEPVRRLDEVKVHGSGVTDDL